MALSNRLWGISYADMLESGFGYDEIYIALIFSAYHFGREIIRAKGVALRSDSGTNITIASYYHQIASPLMQVKSTTAMVV